MLFIFQPNNFTFSSTTNISKIFVTGLQQYLRKISHSEIILYILITNFNKFQKSTIYLLIFKLLMNVNIFLEIIYIFISYLKL